MKRMVLTTLLSGLFITGTSLYAAQKAPTTPSPQAANFLENVDLTTIGDTLETFDNAADQCPADKQALVDSWLPESWHRFSHWACGALYKYGFLKDSSATTGTSADPFE